MNLLYIINSIKNGANPNDVIGQLCAKNPQAIEVIKAMNGKSAEEMKQYTENLAKERGVDLNQLMNNLGMNNKK